MGGKRHKKKVKPAVAPVAPTAFHVFDRPRTSHHWQAVIAVDETETTRVAVQQNWRSDPRVDTKREAELLKSPAFAIEPKSFADFKDQIDLHRNRHSWEIFGLPANGSNRLKALSRSLPLLHVVSLGGSLRFLLKARRAKLETAWVKEFPHLAIPRSPAPDAVWEVAENFNREGLPAIRQLLRLLADCLGPNELPWWATLATELQEPLGRSDWVGVCRRLGLGQYPNEETILILRYKVKDALLMGADLLRPTVIEAGFNEFHYPSPAAAPYGYTMPLEPGVESTCSELLHPPLRGKALTDACRTAFVRLDSDVFGAYDLLELRVHQRARLRKQLPEKDCREWLERHFPSEKLP